MIVKRIDEITKSPNDKREYRGLILENDLKVLLISDKAADKSAVSLSVNIGYLMDPWDLPGLAHFLEHMLFLGTEKYPKEGEYDEYISSMGGSTNASTGSDYTNFLFEVKPASLIEALDRFLQFFIAPLFTESATEREICAVDSEHMNNLKDDIKRIIQARKSLSKPGHDYGKFGTGNKKTLLENTQSRGINLREALLDFHRQFYSSNLMCLTILGNEDLDTLESYLGELNKIKNKKIKRKIWTEHPYGPEECGKMIEIVPIKDIRSLRLLFPFPDLHDEIDSLPANYIAHLIGQEGPGSLISELKRKGLSSYLTAYDQTYAAGFGCFCINIQLSEDGLEKIDEIICLFFNQIGLLIRNGPQKWIQDELARIDEIKFRFKEKEDQFDYVKDLSEKLQYTDFHRILSANHLITDFKSNLIIGLLDRIRAENMICFIVAKKFENQVDNIQEEIYGTEMRINKITEEKISMYNEALNEENPLLIIPKSNEYIPTNFDLKEREETDSLIPRLIRDNEWSRVWFKQDHEFLVPKRITMLMITSPFISEDPLSEVIARLFSYCFEDSLSESMYAAHLVGFFYSFDITHDGKIEIRISGHSEKQDLLVLDFIQKMLDFKPDPTHFNIQKDLYLRNLRNRSQNQPEFLALHYRLLLTMEKYWSTKQLIDCCLQITISDIENFISKVLRRFHLELMVYGNVIEQEVQSLTDEILSHLHSIPNPSRPLFCNECPIKRGYQLFNGDEFIYRHFQETHDSSCVYFIFQCGIMEDRLNILVALLVQCIREKAF